MARYQNLSPIDELRHLDYAIKVSHGEFTYFGDKLGEVAMREEMCRGVDLAGWADPPCRAKKIDPVQFRDDGWQTASPHPPTYYFAAGMTARILHRLGFDFYVDGARLFSALVTALGVMLTFHLTRRVGIHPLVGIAGSLSTLALPSLLHSSAIVTPDAASIAVGATVALVVYRFSSRGGPMWSLALAGALAGGVKLTNVFSAAAGALFLIAGSDLFDGKKLKRPSPETFRRIKAAALLVGSALATLVVWLVIDSARATIDPSIIPQNQLNQYVGTPPSSLLLSPSVILSWLPPGENYLHAAFQPYLFFLAKSVMMTLLTAAGFFAFFRAQRSDGPTQYVACGAATAILGSLLFSLTTTAYTQTLITPQSRYGLALLPLLVLGLTAQVTSKTGRVVITALGAFVVVTVVGSLWMAPTLRLG
jgi:hypothetical protein